MEWRYRETVLALCTLAFFVTMVARLAISPVVPAITAEFEISNTLIGAALTGMWFAYALVQYPSGLLADRYGERLVILASVGGSGAMSLLVAGAPRFWLFFLGTILLGAAAGLHYSVATTLLTRTYDDLGMAIGIHNSGAPAAGLIAPVVVSAIGVRYGWRPAAGVTVAIAVPVFALFARKVRPSESSRSGRPLSSKVRLRSIVELLSRPEVLFTSFVALLFDFVWQGLASFLPTFLTQYHGFSTTFAGAAFASYFVIQGVFQIGVGSVADRYGRDPAIVVCVGAGIAGLALLIVGSGVAAMAVGVTFLGLSMGWGAAVFPRLMDRLSDDERGSGFGLVRTSYMPLAATGSVAVGLLADVFGWDVSFGALILLLVVVLALLAANWRFELGY